MTTIAFVSGKGGVGKTTWAFDNAVQRAHAGRDVLVIDADPERIMAIANARRDKIEGVPHITCVCLYGDELTTEVPKLVKKYDDIIIDTPGHDAPESRSAMVVAKKVITPAQTSQFDLDAYAKIDKLVKLARGFNPKLEALALVNRASTNVRKADADEALTLMKTLQQYRPMESIMRERDIFKRIAKENLAVCELKLRSDSDKSGLAESKALYEEIWA